MRDTTLKGTLLAVAAALAVGACDSGELSRKIAGPGGSDAAIRAQLGGAAGLPGGSYFVASPNDLWNRGTGASFRRAADRYRFEQADVQGASDPRLPVPLADATLNEAFAQGQFQFLGPDFPDWANAPEGGVWNLWGGFSGMPQGRVWLGLARLGVEVNGTLDQVHVLRGTPVTDPDRLVFVGGAPGGNSNRPANLFNLPSLNPGAPDPYPAEPNANPLVLGYVDVGASGNANFDVVLSSRAADGTLVYYEGAFDASRSLVGPNSPTLAFGPSQYNYLIVWGEDPLANPNAAPLVRVQLAVDLRVGSLDPQPNAFPPFPTAALPPATLAELEFRNATPLAPGQVYQFWAVNSATGAASPITGDLRRYEPSGVIQQDSVLGVSEYAGGGGVGDLNVFTVTTSTTGLAFDEFDQIRVTIGPSGGSQPAEVRFLDASYGASLPANGSLRFGGGYSYGGSGDAYFFGDELRIVLTNLPAPPVGYFYEAWLTGSSPRSLGPIQTPYPEYASLRDADQSMQLGQLIAGAARVVNRAELGVNWADFTGVAITLSPKSGASGVVPLHTAFQAGIPAEVGQ